MQRVLHRQLRQHDLRVSADYHQQVIEIVGNSTRQPAHCLHFLSLPELVFQRAAIGHIFGNGFQYIRWLVGAAHRTAADPYRDRVSIFALPPHLDAVHPSSPPELVDQVRVLPGIGEYIPFRIEQQHIFHRLVAQHGNQRRIHIQKTPFQARTVDAIHRTLHQRTVTSFGTPERLLVALDLHRARQLAGYKREDLLVPFSIANVFRIGLDNQSAERMAIHFQRYTHPIQ